ncbi:MAG: insulinase family protein [Firmicutes bacterium]|nr:insulinase family protein [Bacillota bacterium]
MSYSSLINGERLFCHRFANGLRAYILEKPGYKRQLATLAVRFGSLDIKHELIGVGQIDVPAGSAHLLSHLLLEEEEGENVFQRFANLGASIDTDTFKNITIFQVSTCGNLLEVITELIDFVHRPYLIPELTEKTRKIVEHEIRTYQGDCRWLGNNNLLSGLYQENPVRVSEYGTVGSIRQIDTELMLLCYHSFYHPANMALFVAGDVSAQRVVGQISKAFAKHDHFQAPQVIRLYQHEPVEVFQSKVEDELFISRPYYLLGIKQLPYYQGFDLLRHQLIMEFVCNIIVSKSQSYIKELYRRNVFDETFFAEFTASIYYAYLTIGGFTTNVARFDENLRKAILKLKQERIRLDHFEIFKHNICAQHIRLLESIETYAIKFLAFQFQGVYFQDFARALASIDQSDVNNALETSLDLNQATVSVLLPDTR